MVSVLDLTCANACAPVVGGRPSELTLRAPARGSAMPGHFTHIYTARRVADLLAERGRSPTGRTWVTAVSGRTATTRSYCGQVMRKWEKFTAIGAIGPDLFFFSEDWNNDVLGPRLATTSCSPSRRTTTSTRPRRRLGAAAGHPERGQHARWPRSSGSCIKLQKIWNDFVDVWNKTIGPFVERPSRDPRRPHRRYPQRVQGRARQELLNAIETIGEQELDDLRRHLGPMNTVVARASGGLVPVERHDPLPAYVGDLPGARPPGRALRDDSPAAADRFEQFLAFALG